MRCVCDGAVSLCNVATDDMQQTTCQNGIGMDKRQEATENARFATGNRRHARWVRQRTRDKMRLGTCVMQRATDGSQNMYQTRCDVGQATDNTHHATWGTGAGNRKTDHRQRAADTIPQTAMPQTTRKGQRARHHRNMCNRHHATCNAQQGKCNGRHAACNRKRRATCAMQWTTCNT
jgi:hypothetical protein